MGKIGPPPPGGFPGPLLFNVMKSRNLDMVEGRPRDELGGYKFGKDAEELRSKYRSSKISDKDVLVNWNDYEAVYGNVAHQLPINVLLNPVKERGG